MSKEIGKGYGIYLFVLLFSLAALILRIAIFGDVINHAALFDGVVIGVIAGLIAAKATMKLQGK